MAEEEDEEREEEARFGLFLQVGATRLELQVNDFSSDRQMPHVAILHARMATDYYCTGWKYSEVHIILIINGDVVEDKSSSTQIIYLFPAFPLLGLQ